LAVATISFSVQRGQPRVENDSFIVTDPFVIFFYAVSIESSL